MKLTINGRDFKDYMTQDNASIIDTITRTKRKDHIVDNVTKPKVTDEKVKGEKVK